MKNFYADKNILITGGCGTIGKLLIDTLMGVNPKVLRIFDNNEEAMFNIRYKYQDLDSDIKLRYLLGDIRNLNRLQYALRNIDVVFHAASYKHVEECENNPIDAIETNITGTTNLIQAAINQGVKKVIYTSSDKAVNPSNTMGATKLLAEKMIIAANEYSGDRTIFANCRFGNVLGSSGSVIPLFRRQIAEKKKLTITDPKMTRFIISREKAIDLILLAGELAVGGEIFILKMDAVRIGDLADAMIEKYGSAQKLIIGKKPGEKLYEELLTSDEMDRTYEGKNFYVVLPYLLRRDYSKFTRLKKIKTIKNSRQIKPLTKKQILGLLD